MRARSIAWAGILCLAACSGGDPTVTVSPTTTASTATTVVSTTTTSPSTTQPTQPTTTSTSARATPATTATPAARPATTAAAPLFVCPPVPGRATPRADRSRYVVTVDIDPAASRAKGTLSVRFTPDLATDRIVMRLWPNRPQLVAAGANLDPGRVTVDGATVPTQRPNPTTVVAMTAVAAGKTVVVTSEWTLAIARPVSGRVTKVGTAIRLGSFVPILPWEPGVGWALDPATNVAGEDSTGPPADWDLTVAVPPGNDVVATGTQDRSGHWTATAAVNDIGLAVGRFRTATGTAHAPDPVHVTVVADAGVKEEPGPYAAKVVKVIEQYNRRFGPYPYPSYTLAITPGLSGGIEYPMFVHTGPGAIGRSTSHEVGHQYFYGLVANDQGRDPWLDEGLASWAEAGYEGTLASFKARAIPAAAQGRLDRPTTYWDTVRSAYYAGVYVQGVQALGALGSADRVDCALRHYVARNAYRIARNADVIDAMTTVFPNAAAVFGRYGVHP